MAQKNSIAGKSLLIGITMGFGLDIVEIENKISNKIDIIGRNDSFNRVDINEAFPDELQNNKKKFVNLLHIISFSRVLLVF